MKYQMKSTNNRSSSSSKPKCESSSKAASRPRNKNHSTCEIHWVHPEKRANFKPTLSPSSLLYVSRYIQLRVASCPSVRSSACKLIPSNRRTNLNQTWRNDFQERGEIEVIIPSSCLDVSTTGSVAP